MSTGTTASPGLAQLGCLVTSLGLLAQIVLRPAAARAGVGTAFVLIVVGFAMMYRGEMRQR